jgi:hypothetical protein
MVSAIRSILRKDEQCDLHVTWCCYNSEICQSAKDRGCGSVKKGRNQYGLLYVVFFKKNLLPRSIGRWKNDIKVDIRDTILRMKFSCNLLSIVTKGEVWY